MTEIVVNPASPPTAGTTIFAGCSVLAGIYVPSASIAAYQAAARWITYTALIKSQ